MKRQRYRSPDGHDWRDPELPVIGKSGNSIDYRKAEAVAKYRMRDNDIPNYNNDPTYNLRRTRRVQSKA